MWGYQTHYWIGAKQMASYLFDLLDKDLNPQVLLVGFLNQAQEQRHPICIEPEDNEDFKVEDFSSVAQLAQELLLTFKERNIIISDPLSHQRHLDGIVEDAYRDAILSVVNGKKYLRDKVSFVSKPAIVEGYSVFVLLELDKKIFEKYPSLNKTHINERYPISRSLLESAVSVFLRRCAETLQKPNPGSELSESFGNNEELLRLAGENFTYTLSWQAKSIGRNNLFDTLNIISSLRYEGEEGLGDLIIAEKDHSNVTLSVELLKPIELSQSRKVRKILQMAEESTCIISDGYQVFGLGMFVGRYHTNSESLFIIHFLDHYHWVITHQGQPLMRCRYGLPGLVKEGIDHALFHDICSRLFNVSKSQINLLYKIASGVTQQKHGALLVISSSADKEAQRLQGQSFSIKPVELNDQNVIPFTSIDGAVLVDTNGFCHAIGVILDGLATNKGDAARGSRYNSAVRYNEFTKSTNPCLIVVVSEDGMVDLIPHLKRRIHHNKIDNHIKKLSEIADKDTPERRQFSKIYSFLEDHQFYLTDEECLLINKLRKSIENIFKSDGSLTIIRQDLYPDPDMNESYYL